MGFSESKFLSLPPKARAKKLADLLRVILLRLGKDWKQALPEYERLVAWHAPHMPEWALGNSMQHARVLDLYHHWRNEAGLGPERDMYLQQNLGDLKTAANAAITWSVLAHNLRSAYNVGSIIRTADCFGLERINLSGYSTDASHPALRSAARGAEQWMSIERWDSPVQCIQHYRDQGHAIVALETGEDASSLPQFSWPETGLMLLGNEELGIAPELLQHCTHKVAIPMRGRKASLNVASAFAIAAAFLDQNRRQGNALALALLVLVIATVLATALMTGNGNLSHHASRNLNRMQAQYLAESAIRFKCSRFPWAPGDSNLPVSASLAGFPELPPVVVDSSGIWIRMTSTGSIHSSIQTVDAHFGVPLAREAFQAAIRLTAPQAPVDQASMRVEGAVQWNNQGGIIAPHKILEWSSRITQRLWTVRRNRMGIAFHPDSLPQCGDVCARGTQVVSRPSDLPESMEWRIINGDLRLDLGYTGEPTHVPGKRSFLVQGAVLIRGNIQFDTLEILASGPVTMEGEIRASSLEVATESRLHISGTQRYEALLLAEGDIEVQGRTVIHGRSWISAMRQAPDPEAGNGDIELLDGVSVQGWVSAQSNGQAVLKVDSRSRISGIALANNAVQNEGEIFGITICGRLQCAGKTTENCGGPGEFIRDSLPIGFLQPPSFDFGQPRKLMAFQWRVL